FFSSRRRHTRFSRDWSSDVCSSDLGDVQARPGRGDLRDRPGRAVHTGLAHGGPRARGGRAAERAGAAGGGRGARASAVAAKWLLVGRIRPGEHPLWSSFVWRNEVADTFVETVAAPWFARAATGTPVLTLWL